MKHRISNHGSLLLRLVMVSLIGAVLSMTGHTISLAAPEVSEASETSPASQPGTPERTEELGSLSVEVLPVEQDDSLPVIPEPPEQGVTIDNVNYSACNCIPVDAGAMHNCDCEGFTWYTPGGRFENKESDDNEYLICPIPFEDTGTARPSFLV